MAGSRLWGYTAGMGYSLPLERAGRVDAMRLASLSLAALLSASAAFASEEDHLPWRDVGVECFEHAQTGKVSVKARADARGVSSFVLHAFGKDHALSKAQLQQIRSFPLESLQVTHEAGYSRLGGHTVHARLRKGEETARVSVAKAGGLKVSIDRSALYERLEKECADRLSPGCCSASVEAMRKGGFAPAAADGSCPAGTAPDMMRCKDSLRWCAPPAR